MRKLVSYLETHRELNVSLAISYFILIIALHGPLVKLSVWTMEIVSFAKYNLIIGAIMTAALCAFVFSFASNVKNLRTTNEALISYFLIITGLLIIHVNLNCVMNIEVIHTLQFGIMAALIFPLTRSFGATLYYTVLLGMVDEAYQYVLLYPDRSDYFDFNDLVLDQLGAALALLYIYSSGITALQKEGFKWYKSPVIISFGMMAITIGALFQFSLMSVYSSATSEVLFLLNEAQGPESFWRFLPNSQIVYHVLTPQEGTIIIILICGLFIIFDQLAAKKAQDTMTPKEPSRPVLRIVRSEENEGKESIPASPVLRMMR